MFSGKQSLRVLATFAIALALVSSTSCTGFFQNPTLTSVTVGPTLTLDVGNTGQLSATGTYNDGSTKALSSGLVWNSSDPSTATVSATGQVTAVAIGSATITAAQGTVNGTSSVTVVQQITALRITPTTGQTTVNGLAVSYMALATVPGQSTPQNVSSTAQWAVTSTSGPGTGAADFSLSLSADGLSESVQPLSTAVAGEVATITATYVSTTTTYTATATLTVN